MFDAGCSRVIKSKSENASDCCHEHAAVGNLPEITLYGEKELYFMRVIYIYWVDLSVTLSVYFITTV